MEGAHPDYIASLHSHPSHRSGCLLVAGAFLALAFGAVVIAIWRAM